jgi:ABC-type Fe3+ transport system permease subunit
LHYWAAGLLLVVLLLFLLLLVWVRVWSSLESEISLLLTRRLHWRTDHWFALLGCGLLLPLLLLFLLLLLFVVVVILLMIQKTPSLLLVDGREVYWQGRSEIGIYSEESRSAEGCRRNGVITQVHKAACTGA